MKTVKRGSVRNPPFIEFCTCGHTGGQAASQHGPRYSPGHGPCEVDGCPCQQFTWAKQITVKP